MSDVLKDRGQALEDIFFAERDRELIAALKEKAEREKAVVDLARITGIDDAAVLDRITGLGVRPDTLTAVSVVPLLFVAWADDTLDPAEREAILTEALDMGLHRDAPAYQLLESWLTRAPNPELFDAWKAYHAELVGHLGADERARLRDELLVKARRIARASGGMLGFGAVSGEEGQAIQRLEALLSEG